MAKYVVVCQLTAHEVEPIRCYLCVVRVVRGFVYETAEGMPEVGLARGAGWADVPMDWRCPDRGVAKKDCEMEKM